MTPEEIRQVLHTAARAEDADGVAPLDEATLLTVRHRPEAAEGWVSDEGFVLLIENQVHLCVDPSGRGHGLGGRLLAGLLEEVLPRRLDAWSHADHPAARQLARRHGFEPVRELWLMRRSADLRLEPLVVPDGISIRGFRTSDTPALLELNAASFARHPEQGRMGAADFAERRSEPWFDPAGLLVAEDDEGRMLGFHWTKTQDRARGEVYVIAIAPASQGLGMGRLLTLAGLHHLYGRGAREVELYVESDNAPAIRIYQDKLGFTHDERDTHVMYQNVSGVQGGADLGLRDGGGT